MCYSICILVIQLQTINYKLKAGKLRQRAEKKGRKVGRALALSGKEKENHGEIICGGAGRAAQGLLGGPGDGGAFGILPDGRLFLCGAFSGSRKNPGEGYLGETRDGDSGGVFRGL